ncbi:MAG: ABC transporter permease [Ancalomicrobiaceae bacterium]|nr:ABC transporter permease [Ancalomicrobiaceae bacterium]
MRVPRPQGARLADGLAGLLLLIPMVFWALAQVHDPQLKTPLPVWFWWGVVGIWAFSSFVVVRLASEPSPSRTGQRILDLFIPVAFGICVLFLWEVITIGAGVPKVLMPSPSAIAARLATAQAVLSADFEQTVLKEVLPGWFIGSGAGFLIALVCDRVPFLARGLLPIGNFVSALPMIGVAPIMVMWFGFDWPSKVAIVVIMTFFPALVNSVAGLAAAGKLERDLMRSYGAGFAATLLKLRLPAALPFIFNALKINSTLAMIGAIVAEFFGSPTVGMGFRISTEVGRSNLDMVWAEITMAAITGSIFYGVLALAERLATFWHPSYRKR